MSPPLLTKRARTQTLQAASLFAYLLFLAVLATPAQAASLHLDADKTQTALGAGHLSLLRDPARKLTVEEAINSYRKGEFSALSGNLSLGFTKDAVWLAISVHRPADAPEQWVLRVSPPTLDVVTLFQMTPGQTLKQVNGDGIPLSKRAMDFREPAFTLNLAEGETLLMLRIQTTSQMTAGPFLTPAAHFSQVRTTDTLLIGLSFGFMLTVFIYNLIIGIGYREIIYLLYCIYTLLLTTYWFIFDGLLAIYVLPENPLLANQMLGALLGIILALGAYFYTVLFKIGPAYRISHLLIKLCYSVGVASSVSVFFGAFHHFMPWLLITIILSVAILGPHALRLLRHPDTDMRLFGASYLILSAQILFTVLMNLSLLPATLWTIYSAQLGQLLMALSLHLGLYYRMKLLEKQRDAERLRAELAGEEALKERRIRHEQEQLLHMIGHEVRTPVSIIESAIESLELIEKDSAPSPEKTQRYKHIHRAVERMEMLMKLVGADQKALQGNWEQPRVTPFHFLTLCQANLDLLVDGIHRIDWHCPTGWNPVIKGDENLVGFAVLNLYDNALKYALEGPIEARLEPQRQDGKDGACLCLCNPAKPLAPGMEERIFEKFVRLDEQSGQPGLGLGLYLARRIVEQHQGTLRAHNRGERRVCFELWLPLDEGDTA